MRIPGTNGWLVLARVLCSDLAYRDEVMNKPAKQMKGHRDVQHVPRIGEGILNPGIAFPDLA